MHFTALAPFALALCGFVAAPIAHATPADPACDDHVKKPTGDGEKPPKASTDLGNPEPLCEGDGKKPTGDGSEKQPKS